MSKISNLRDLINGKKMKMASFWGHFYKEEQNWETFLSITGEFQKRYDWDFLKINPSSTFFVEDWGNVYLKKDKSRSEMLEHRIKQPEDFLTLDILDPRSGNKGDQLKVIKALVKEFSDTPVIATIFNPLSYASRLCGGVQKLREYMKTEPLKVEKGLETILISMILFTDECLKEGVSGFFYATTDWGDRNLLAPEEYKRFCGTNDLKILEHLRERSMFLILHVCKNNNRLKDLLYYPVDALSWDFRNPTNPSVAEISGLTDKIIIGGISHSYLDDNKHFAKIEKEIASFQRETENIRSVIAGGCTFTDYHPEVFDFIKNCLVKSYYPFNEIK